MQQPSCHVADGKLAAVKVAKGDYAEAERLYREHLDLDPGLAMAWGAGALASGKNAQAQEPYRQALKMDPSANPEARLGLALVYEAQGDWQTAKGHFQRAVAAAPYDVMAVQLWLDAVRRAEGDAAAAKATNEFAAAHPDTPTAFITRLQQAQRSGDEAATTQAVAAGDAFFASYLGRAPRSSLLLAGHARFLFLAGRLTEADQAADAAVKIDPANAQAWLVKSDVAAALGSTDAAATARRRAGQSDSTNPAYARLLGQR